MSIRLTSFELLTMSESDPVKQQFHAEQAAQAAEVRVDYTTEGFEYPRQIGRLSLKSLSDVELVEDVISTV